MGRMMRPEFLVDLAGTVHAVIAEKFVDRVSPFGNPAIYFWAQDVHTGQVQERNQGVVTDRVRARLAELASIYPGKVFSVDSRTRIGEFRGLTLKPNRSEAALALDAAHSGEVSRERAAEIGLALSHRSGRPVYLTLSEDGVLVCAAAGVPWGRIAEASPAPRNTCIHVAGVAASGPIDPVGAGDSACAGIVSALCAGATPAEAALVGNLVASITIQQLGTTGAAAPSEVLARYRELTPSSNGQ